MTQSTTPTTSAAATPAPAPTPDLTPIGPTPIRFYSGNLSVGMFMKYWGKEWSSPLDIVSDELLAILKRTSQAAMCDYPSWVCTEPEEGKWDFSAYQKNAEKLHANGIGYTVFCWLHFPPKWYENSPRMVPYVNMVTGQSIPQISLWSPDLPRVYDEYYRRLAEAMGPQIDFLRLAMPSEYGEIGYCARMTDWLRPQEHAAPGYWCGDPHARADFRREMMKKYLSLDKINATWDTAFKTEDGIALPDPAALEKEFATSATARRRWVDFIDWYQEAQTHTLATIDGIIKKHFPGKEVIASVGYASEQPMLGNDESRHIAAMAKLGISCQSPGDVGFLATRRVSSACRQYKVRYYTEPPGDVPRDRQLNRIYWDISNGVQNFFDYPPNLDRARDYFRQYKHLLTGAPPRTTVAVWHPTLDHWLHPADGWSAPLVNFAELLRETEAYEVVDDRMILDGALASLGTRQLVLAGANWLDGAAWQAVQRWVEAGGVLIVLQGAPITDIDGSGALWQKQAPANIPKLMTEANTDTAAALATLWEKGGQKLGRGLVVTIDTTGAPRERIVELVARLTEDAGARVGHPEWNAPLLDGHIDGVFATRFDDRLLYFNMATEPRTVNLALRESDFPPGAPRPAALKQTLQVPARTIVEVPLAVQTPAGGK